MPVGSADDITYVHAANAIGAFEASAWRADNSRFDRFLRGDAHALTFRELYGLILFYGRAGCSSCHTGAFQTDHGFHAIAMPQIGPGKGDGIDGHDDFGRERVTGDYRDRYAFRTPTLRNVAITGPWGHDGAFDSLEAIVRHHLDPESSLDAYDPEQAVLPPREDLDAVDTRSHDDPVRRSAVRAACELVPVTLDETEIAALLDFLGALTDPGSLDMRGDVPMSVPSGLPVFD
jgi:cytochrome c peroxidase